MPALRNVALVIDASQPYDRKVVQGIAAYVRQAGNWSIYLEERPQEKMPDLDRWSGDGIIADLDDQNVAEALRRKSLPIVGIGGGYGGYDPASRIPYFVSNEDAIARLAADHLLERGLTHLAFCGFPRTRINLWSHARGEAFRRYLAGKGMQCSLYTGRHRSARRWDNMLKGLMDWLDSLPKPLGLMACDDVRARHVLEACRRLDLRVPDDVAVIGVDNNEMLCELTTTPLTSIEQGLRRMGFEAAALLDRMIGGATPSQTRFVIDPETVVTRRSTDVLAVADADVAEAARFVRERACDGIGVSDVVRAVQTSRSTLERKFKSLIGRTVHDEIQRIRLEHVARLLAISELTIKQVAAQNGFAHVPYMTTLFRRRYGCTPGQYRNRAKKTE